MSNSFPNRGSGFPAAKIEAESLSPIKYFITGRMAPRAMGRYRLEPAKNNEI
jgi:hypothetical protein